MRRTSVGILLAAAVLGAGGGFLLDHVLVAGGRPTFTPAVTLPILLILLGAVTVVLALPISRATRGRGAPVNPFRAVRIAMLAKASTIVGAAMTGFGLGLLVFRLSTPVVPSLGSLTTIIATAVCGAALIAAGLVAEQLCTIRKDDDDDQPGATGA
jgi:hypothetical protein